MCQARNSSQEANGETSKIACLNDVRGVLHLGGEDIHHFLNVRKDGPICEVFLQTYANGIK